MPGQMDRMVVDEVPAMGMHPPGIPQVLRIRKVPSLYIPLPEQDLWG